ncbi:hypothetical protein AB1M95_06305 [Sulfitobacter sp. LCG007]
MAVSRSGTEISGPTPKSEIQRNVTPAAPEGLLVASGRQGGATRLGVSYRRGDPLPRIRIERLSEQVQTIYADGLPVIVVAAARPVGIAAEDVLLVER